MNGTRRAAATTHSAATVVDRGPSVVVVLRDADEYILVGQERDAVGTKTLELVQERIEPGEAPLAAAQRGLSEELGLRAESWEEHGSFWAVPAYSNQRVFVFTATVAEGTAGGHEETSTIRCGAAELDDLLDDAISIAGLEVVRRSSGLERVA